MTIPAPNSKKSKELAAKKAEAEKGLPDPIESS